MTNQTDLTLAAVDVDGAVRETADAAAGDTRSAFLARAGMLGGGALGAGALLHLLTGEAGAQSRRDVNILNFALTLEYLEAAFYTEAVAMGALSGELRLFARVVGGHERAHVRALRTALGSAAVARPRFNFRGTTEDADLFAATAQVLEDTGVAAYAGQAPRIRSDAVLDAALAIHTVEARHAAWIRGINGALEAPRDFDGPLSRRRVLARVTRTRFIVAQAPSDSGSSPSFTG